MADVGGTQQQGAGGNNNAANVGVGGAQQQQSTGGLNNAGGGNVAGLQQQGAGGLNNAGVGNVAGLQQQVTGGFNNAGVNTIAGLQQQGAGGLNNAGVGNVAGKQQQVTGGFNNAGVDTIAGLQQQGTGGFITSDITGQQQKTFQIFDNVKNGNGFTNLQEGNGRFNTVNEGFERQQHQISSGGFKNAFVRGRGEINSRDIAGQGILRDSAIQVENFGNNFNGDDNRGFFTQPLLLIRGFNKRGNIASYQQITQLDNPGGNLNKEGFKRINSQFQNEDANFKNAEGLVDRALTTASNFRNIRMSNGILVEGVQQLQSVIDIELPRTPINSLPIPVMGSNFTNFGGCGDSSVRMTDGKCYPLLRQGPCSDPGYWLTIDPNSLTV